MEEAGPMAAILFFILLLVDVFVYGFGTAITHLNEKEVERRAQEDKERRSEKLLRIMEQPDSYVNLMQLTATLINIVAGAYYLVLWSRGIYMALVKWAEGYTEGLHISAETLLSVLGGSSLVVATVVLLYIILTFGVLLPKKMAARKPERWAYICIGPAWFLMKLFAPFTGLISVSVKGIMYLLGMGQDDNLGDVTEEEIINIVQEGFEQGVIEDSEAEMISNILAYGDKEAQDIMTHRSNVVAIDGETLLEDAINFMLDGINSRYPVYEENIDHIIGILHLKDALRYRKSNGGDRCAIKDLSGLIREAHFVPQTKNIDELFEEMQSQKLHMVIVVDEYGQMDGLVAMEDILEEIVGNILDEYDVDTEYIEDRGNDEYIMEGKTPLEDLTERFGIGFEGEAFETLNGFMIYRLDHIPEPGELFEFDYQGYRFAILSVENKMIQSVLVTKLPEEDLEESDADMEKGQSALEEY